MTIAIKFENVSKRYRLGEVGSGTIADDLHRAWAKFRGQPDPLAKVGQVNDRAVSSEKRETTKTAFFSRLSPTTSSRDYVWALRDIDFNVKQGEILGIIGRNGAGKSTLLKLLSRVTAPTTGSIKSNGRFASLLEVGTGFHPELTGRENIYLNGAILGMRRHETTKQLEAIVDFSGCAKYIDTPVKRYSSGMTVRLGFSVAAHLDCEILVVDEVLAVGDMEFQRKCIGKMQEVGSGGRTVLFVSHNLVSVRKLCKQGVVLENGKLAFSGSIDSAIDEYSNNTRDLSSKVDLNLANRSGTGKAKFTRVRFQSPEGHEIAEVASGDDFSIVIDYHTIDTEALRNVVCSVALKDEFDNCCWLVRSTFDGIQLDLSEGNSIECQVTDFALAPGIYCVVLFISERDNETIDYVDNASYIEVKPGQFFTTGSSGLPTHCKVLTRAKWTIG